MEKIIDNGEYILCEEKIKSKYRKFAFLTSSILLICAVSSFLFGLFSGEESLFTGFSVFLNAFFLFALVLFIISFNESCTKELKEKLYNTYLAHSFPNLERSDPRYELVTEKFLTLSGLFNMYSNKQEDDAFLGKYKDIPYSVVNLILTQKGNKSERTVFNGLLIKMKFPFEFEGITIIQPKGTRLLSQIFTFIFSAFILLCVAVMLFCITSDLHSIATMQGFLDVLPYIVCIAVTLVILFFILKSVFKNKTKAVNIDFSELKNKYEAFCADTRKSDELITSDLLNRIEQFKKDFNSKGVGLSFVQNYLFVTAKTKRNLFEVGNLFTKSEGLGSFRETEADINKVIEFIKYLSDDSGIRDYNK